MASVSKSIDDILVELEGRRNRERSSQVDQATGDARTDVITSSLRSLEQSLNAAKHARGEPPIQIVPSASEVDEPLREDIESVAGQLDLDPAAVTATLGVRLWNEGKKEQARPLLEAAAEGGDAMGAGTLGLLLKERGETERALEYLERAAKDGDNQARYNLALMLADRGQVEQAIPLLIDNPDPRAADLLARLRS
jgi:tetratricopeptide (TPR) repeat protein